MWGGRERIAYRRSAGMQREEKWREIKKKTTNKLRNSVQKFNYKC